jgi:hypothetical protein
MTGGLGTTLEWFDAPIAGNSVNIGDSLLFSYSTSQSNTSSTDTFYVEAKSGGAGGFVGAPNNGQATGYTLEAGLFFDVLSSQITIKGVYVYPLGTGAGTVEIGIKETVTGNIIQRITVNLTGSNPGIRTYVPLGFVIPNGVDYQMLMLSKTGGVTGLVRDGAAAITGGGFPFTIPGVISITGGQCCSANARSTSYYYFYDWELESGCTSARTMVIGEVNCTVGLDRLGIKEVSLSISPNPSNGLINLNVETPKAETLIMIVRDLNGKAVHEELLNVNGSFNKQLDFTRFAKGIYYLQIQSRSISKVEKIVIR